jgi:hypothetical protein
MQLPSIQARTNNMSVSSPAQALPSIGLATSADGKSIHQGDTIIITWQSSNSPPGAGVALFPQKALTGHIFRPITTSLPASGSYTWQVPIYVSLPIPCAPDRTGGCIGSMNPGTTYRSLRGSTLRATLISWNMGPPRPIPLTSRQQRAVSLSCLLRLRAGNLGIFS